MILIYLASFCKHATVYPDNPAGTEGLFCVESEFAIEDLTLKEPQNAYYVSVAYIAVSARICLYMSDTNRARGC